MHVVVIPAAGQGARFQELGKFYQKCLLPYKGRIVLDHLVSKIRESLDHDQIVVVRKKEDENLDLWNLVKGVTYKPVLTNLTQGPATSLLSGIPDQQEDFRLTVVLSDMILSEEFEFPEEDSVSVFPSVEDPSRWCLFDGSEFYEKPEQEVPEDAKALAGIYSFSSGKVLRDCLLGICEGHAEPQFSQAMRLYQKHRNLSRAEVHWGSIVDLGVLERFLKEEKPPECRFFNTIDLQQLTATKSSTVSKEKLYREFCWLSYPPTPFQERVPRVLDYNSSPLQFSFRMERLLGRNLRHMFLYYNREISVWKSVFSDLRSILVDCYYSTNLSCDESFWKTTFQRFSERTGGALSPVVEELKKEDQVLWNYSSFYHGDLHLANLFWTEQERVKVVDPRGELYGHWLYDLAKLYHSFIGRYDLIDEGLYLRETESDQATYYEAGLEPLRKLFETEVVEPLQEIAGFSLKSLQLLCACLFGSMIPLHRSTENCLLFVAECLRLCKMAGYPDLVDEKSLQELVKAPGGCP